MAIDLTPDLDFLGENKPLIIGGAAAALIVFVIGRNFGKTEEAPAQQATLIPSEGASWADIVGRRNSGVIGVIGPGEPVPGDSAYELAVKNGFKGTLQEWLDSLEGPPGLQGPQGPQGPGTTPTEPPPTSGLDPNKYGDATELIDQTGKPYYCPSGSFMTWERGGKRNHVCQIFGSGKPRQFQVTYRNPPKHRYPAVGGEAVTNPVPRPLSAGTKGSITVKHGDTLKSLATRGYGVSHYWPILLARNPGKTQPRVGEVWNL